MSQPNEHLAKSVMGLDLSIRAANVLTSHLNLDTVADLVKLTEKDILKAKTSNQLVLKEIKDLLAEMGLMLGMK